MRSDQPLGVPVKVRTDTSNKLKGVKKGIQIYIYIYIYIYITK